MNSTVLQFGALTALFLSAGLVSAQGVEYTSDNNESEDQMEEILVTSVRQRLEQAGVLKDVIEKTEVIGVSALESARATNLTEALASSPGADVAVDCSLCGMKRVRLNGLRAEHTTILVDGLPSHTIASGFYGIDALAMTGVEAIEVARGAGASMLAPEAIGGVVNIVTVESPDTGLMLDFSGGEVGYLQAGLLGTYASEDGATRLTVIGQFDERDQADEDNNGVSENPYLNNQTLSARISHDISWTDNITARVSFVEQESFGGPIIGDTASSISSALNSFVADPTETDPFDLFEGGDVRNKWTASPWETTEWVDTSRQEASLTWLHEFNESWNMELAGSYARHEQDSFYEGFDYYADDRMSYLRAVANFTPNDAHLLTFGVDSRRESLDSQSDSGDALNNDGDPNTVYISDTFDYDTTGFFVQDAWYVNDNLEIKAALRVDAVTADFTDPSKTGTEIDETVISPRVDLRYYHNDTWTSRISAGRGYRAPLSFFETDHGLLDAGQGFLIDVNELERSISVGYSLSYAQRGFTSTLSLAVTDVEGLALLGESGDGVPLLDQTDDKARVTAVDLSIGYQMNEFTTLSLVAEKYSYDSNFRQAYAIIPVEEQVGLSADIDWQGWEFFTSLTWVGSRDLARFGYDGYNTLLDNTYIDESSVKKLNAPSFWGLDLRVAKEFRDNWTFYAGANNLFDYSQAGDEDSPLLWVPGERDAGGLQHDGFDVVYIHGPLRGRELFAGVQFEF